MKKTKVWLIAATSLILIGCILFAGVMTALKWDFGKLSTYEYETNTYEFYDDYDSISINVSVADIEFKVSENEDITTVVCYEQTKGNHKVEVSEEKLIITHENSKKWYENIGIDFDTPKITLYIPQNKRCELVIKGSTGDIKIPKNLEFWTINIESSTGNVENYASARNVDVKLSTGNITVKHTTTGFLNLYVTTGNITVSDTGDISGVTFRCSTGKTKVENVNCETFFSYGSTGGLYIKNVIASERVFIERSTGDVKFDGCDAKKIHVSTHTGDVTGSLLTPKVFTTKTDTGTIDVPNSTTGDKCEISTTTGDINISVSGN